MAKNITFCGAVCALSLVILLMTNIFTFNTVFLVCAATAVFPLVKIKCGGGWAAAACAACGLLSVMLLPDKFTAAAYVFLAFYSVLKGAVEKINRIWLEILIKAAVYFAAAAAMLLFFGQPFFVAMLAGGAAVFAVYDFALSIFITFLRKKLRF